MDMNKNVQRTNKVGFLRWLVAFVLITAVMSVIFVYADSIAFGHPDWSSAIGWGTVCGFFGSFSYIFYFKKNGQ